MRIRQPLLLGAVTALLAGPLVMAPAEATIGWDRGAFVVPQGTVEELMPQVVVDSAGDRHVVYYDQDKDVWLVEVDAGGDAAEPKRLFAATDHEFGGYPRIAIDDQDRITVVWYVTDHELDRRSHVESRAVSADGVLGEKQVLSDLGDSAYYPEVAVDSTGVATVVWENELGGGWPGRVQAVRLAPGTGIPLGPVVDLEEPGGAFPDGIGVRDVTVAVDGSDRAVVAWARFDGDADGSSRNSTIRAVRLSTEGTPGVIRTVSDDPSVDARYPQVAVAPDGTATIVYTRFDSVAGTVATRLSAADFTPGTSLLVSDPSRQTWDDPAVTVDGQGRVTAAWIAQGPDGLQTETRRIGADGALEPQRAPLGLQGEIAARFELIALASDPEGRVTVAWPGADGDGTRMHAVRLQAVDGTPSTTHRLSSPGGFSSFGEVIDIAVDARGRASVVWSRDGAAAVRRSRAPGRGPVPAKTWIVSGPRDGAVAEDETPRFTFEADTVEATFRCRIDDGRWRSCSSPMSTRPLRGGRHVLEVRAVDGDGTPPDRSPAVARFRVQ